MMARAERGRWAARAGVALAGVLGVLTCGQLALRSPDPSRLRFSHTFTTESERAIVDDAVREFERTHPGVGIEQTVLNSEVYQNIGWRLHFRGRLQPDLYFLWRGYKSDLAVARGWGLDLRPYLSPSFAREFVGTSVPEEGPVYFLPQSVDLSNVVWYNRDLFAREGLKPPETMEAWMALNAALRRAGHLPLGQGNRDLWPMGNFAAELLGQGCGTERMRGLFEPGAPVETATLSGLRWLQALRDGGAFDQPGILNKGSIASLGDIDAKVLFLTGKSAQHAVGSWFLADIADAARREELKFAPGFFPIPSGAGEVDATTAVMTGFMVNPRTRNPAAAAQFLELLLSRRYQERFAKLGTLSLRRDAVEFTFDPLGKELLKALGAAKVVVPPPDTGFPPAQAALFYELCGGLLAGKLGWAELAGEWEAGKRRLEAKGL